VRAYSLKTAAQTMKNKKFSKKFKKLATKTSLPSFNE
jgi:hypothetical protein